MSFYVQGLPMFVICLIWLLTSFVTADNYPELLHRDRDELFQPSYALQNILRNMEVEEDTSELKMANKRALSILTRWKNLGGVGRRTNALTNSPRAPLSLMQGDANDSRLRRVTGPLRWGRRR